MILTISKMSLLPEITQGQLVLDRDEKKIIAAPINTERKRKLKEALAFIRMNKYKSRGVDSIMEELNNMGHNKVAEDFSDSPFADREEEENEDE